MRVPAPAEYPVGYTPVTAVDGFGREMRMDFGILRAGSGRPFEDREPKERAFLLLDGAVRFEWEGRAAEVRRGSMTEEAPAALHVPAGLPVKITALSGSAELSVHRVPNPADFAPRYIGPEQVKSQRLRAGRLADTTERLLRTVLDDENAPWSAMTVGELINYPGRWSSYPPHHHPQPEIYHYRFFPAGGFGYSEQGEEVFKVRDRDTVLIPPDVTHPQVAAPGYTMVYVWAIPHLPEARFLSDSRIFSPEHSWVLGG